MALNLQTFRTRALTAVVFVIVMMGGLLYNQWSFFLLFTLVHFGAWIEYQKLVTLINPDYKLVHPIHRYVLPLAGWCLVLFFSNDALQIGDTSLTEVGFWAGISLMMLLPLGLLLEAKNFLFKNISYSLLGILYISLPLALMVDLRTRFTGADYQLSTTLPLLIIFSLWINDTMAYIVGSLIGKTPLSKVSPKKTWEGTTGGVILTVVVISLLAYLTGRVPVVHAAVMAALAGIIGTFGDLFESKLKRLAGVKDSGSIMPGHGGFLDRFDSLLFAAVIVWFYVEFVFAA